MFCWIEFLSFCFRQGLRMDLTFAIQSPDKRVKLRKVLIIYYNDFRDNRIKTRKERKYSFPIREVLMHRLKVRMMPFKNAEKHVKIFMEKFMDIVAVFITPLSYIILKDWWCKFL